MSRLLFIGIQNDPHLVAIKETLHENGCEVNIVNSRALKTEPFAPQSISDKKNMWDAIWVRYLPPLFPGSSRHFTAQDIQKQRAIRSFLLQWLKEQQRNKVLVFPQLSDGTYDQYKGTDLNFAKQAQIATPKTICALNIECALDFINNQHKEIVVKPIIGGAYTTILAPKTLKEKLAHWGPLILQERITGQNCRVLYFENQPLKAFIAPPLEEIDWRECDNVLWQPYELSKNLQLKLLHFFKLGKHTMASVDLIVNSNDSYFLEANTTPSWLDLPQKCAREQTLIVAQFFLQKCAC